MNDDPLLNFSNVDLLTSRDRSCRKPHTQAATDTGETKKRGMKTSSQKRVPRSIPSQTRTSNISRRRWMPTAINMALNSTHVSPSALKSKKKKKNAILLVHPYYCRITQTFPDIGPRFIPGKLPISKVKMLSRRKETIWLLKR